MCLPCNKYCNTRIADGDGVIKTFINKRKIKEQKVKYRYTFNYNQSKLN